MLLRFLRLIGLFTATEPVESGAAPGEAPPVDGSGGAPAPGVAAGGAGAPSEPSLDGMDDAARNRVLSGTPVDELAPDDLPYRDAKALRDEMARTRDQYGPAAAALEALPAAQREGFLALAPAQVLAIADPEVGRDIAALTAAYPQLDAQSREILGQIVAHSVATNDPAPLAQAVSDLYGNEGEEDDPNAPATDPFGFEIDDPNRPMTRADFEREYESRQQAQAREAQIAEAARGMHAEMVELGYRPDSNDPVELGLADALVSIARRLPDGSIAKAHDVMLAMRQHGIDEYVSGKTADADRPQPTPDGSPVAGGTQRLGSLDEMDQAMKERLAAG